MPRGKKGDNQHHIAAARQVYDRQMARLKSPEARERATASYAKKLRKYNGLVMGGPVVMGEPPHLSQEGRKKTRAAMEKMYHERTAARADGRLPPLVFGTRPATEKQLAARRLFAERARAGTLPKKGRKQKECVIQGTRPAGGAVVMGGRPVIQGTRPVIQGRPVVIGEPVPWYAGGPMPLPTPLSSSSARGRKHKRD